MVDAHELIWEAAATLKKAFKAAAGNVDAQDQIRQRLEDLADLDGQITLDRLMSAAETLNKLSDQLDAAMRAVALAGANFFLADLIKLKAQVADASAEHASEVRLPPAVDAAQPNTGASAGPAPAPVQAAPATAIAVQFNAAQIRPDWLQQVERIVDRILANGARYRAVEKATSVPWWFIAILHSLEANGDFSLHLHNGDPLTARTIHVPAGRPTAGTPPFAWEDSAADALDWDRLSGQGGWTLPNVLDRFERYNGVGYRKRGLPSPYLWSGSDQYTKGKYTSDGNFDPDAVSKQVGAAVLLKRMVERALVVVGQPGQAVATTAAATLSKPGLLTIDLTPFPHAAAEINFPGAIQKGSAGPNVSRVQEWCVYHHFSTSVDGGFGDATAKTVADFQAARGLNATGVVDEATWLQLTLPMRCALAPLARKPPSIYEATLAVARQHIAEKPIEIGGPNAGPWVRLYMTANQGPDQLWCAGFVCFMIQQAARDLDVAMPIPRQVGVAGLVADAQAAGRFIPEASLPNGMVRMSKLPSGAIFVRRDPNKGNTWVHTGLLAKAGPDTFDTLEGNTTGIVGGSDGNCAVARTRAYPNTDFLLLV